jgi:hypothetical protein
MLIEPLKGADDTFVHSKRPKSPVGDVGRDSVEAFLDVSPGSADLRFLGSLRGEVSVFDFKGKRAEDLGAVSPWNATDEGGREPSKHPLVGLAHTELSPGAIDKGGDRYGALLNRIGTAFALGGEGNPDLRNGTRPDAEIFDDGEKLGKTVPDRYWEELEVLNGPTIESPGFALGHAENGRFEVQARKIGDGVILRVGTEEVSVFFLEFAEDSRALGAMEDVFVPSEGGKVGKFLGTSDKGRAIGAEQKPSADGRFVFGPPVALSLAASLGSIPCFAKVYSPGGGVCPLGLRKMETGNTI